MSDAPKDSLMDRIVTALEHMSGALEHARQMIPSLAGLGPIMGAIRSQVQEARDLITPPPEPPADPPEDTQTPSLDGQPPGVAMPSDPVPQEAPADPPVAPEPEPAPPGPDTPPEVAPTSSPEEGPQPDHS